VALSGGIALQSSVGRHVRRSLARLIAASDHSLTALLVILAAAGQRRQPSVDPALP